MKIKTLSVAVVVLAILAFVSYWYNRPTPPPPPDARVGKPVLDASVIDQAASVKIVDQGKTVALSRGQNGAWTVDSYYGLPADFSKLSGLTNDLANAKIVRVVTHNPALMERLDFGGTKVEFLDHAGKDVAEVDLGKNADEGGRYLRYGPEPKAYLADLNTWIDSDPKDWADSTLVNVKADDVSKIEFPFDAAKPIVAVRKTKTASWSADDLPKGEQLAPDKITSALSTLTSLRFTDSAALTDPNVLAAKQHLRVFRLTTFDGKTVSIAMGRKPEEKKLKPAAEVKPAASAAQAGAKTPAKPAAPAKPEYDTIPAGPVYAFIHTSETNAPIDAMMAKRAFQVDDYNFTSLPQKPADLLETAPPPPPAPKPAAKAAGKP